MLRNLTAEALATPEPLPPPPTPPPVPLSPMVRFIPTSEIARGSNAYERQARIPSPSPPPAVVELTWEETVDSVVDFAAAVEDQAVSPFSVRPGGVPWPALAALLGGVLVALAVLLALRRLRLRLQCCVSCGEEDGAARRAADGVALLHVGARRSDDVEAGSSAKHPEVSDDGAGDRPKDGACTGRWSLEGRVAVVTGGSKGLGRAIVEELLLQGCEVFTCARDPSPLDELVASNALCHAVAADVSTPAGRAALIATLTSRYSQNLDILVNNVGTNLRKPTVEYTDREYEHLCATNQGAAFHLTRALYLPLRNRRGCVVNVSSVSGSTVDSTGSVYHMNKAAVEHMTRYLACEWGAHGIRVNAVAPWFIRTPLTAPLLADGRFHAGPTHRALPAPCTCIRCTADSLCTVCGHRFHDAVRRATPMRRVGEAHEVACVVAFLCMPAAGYISGQVQLLCGSHAST